MKYMRLVVLELEHQILDINVVPIEFHELARDAEETDEKHAHQTGVCGQLHGRAQEKHPKACCNFERFSFVATYLMPDPHR
jgi:hypothetical protein